MSEAYLAKASGEPGVVKTASGLIYHEDRAGTGASPVATDTVKVNYRGTLVDGTEFDSSYKRNAPAEFKLNGVIPCWTEAVQKMKVGGKATLVCPSDLAWRRSGAAVHSRRRSADLRDRTAQHLRRGSKVKPESIAYFIFLIQLRTGPETVVSGVPIEKTSDM